jgi:hypothetical protein
MLFIGYIFSVPNVEKATFSFHKNCTKSVFPMNTVMNSKALPEINIPIYNITSIYKSLPL